MPMGGRRPGSGRKPGQRSIHHKIATDVARQVLSEVDSVELWKKFLHCNSPKVASACLQYLTDRAFGRPAQVISGSGPPIKVEFSWGAPTPDWMPPARVERRVIPKIEESLQHVISEQVIGQVEHKNRK